MNIIEKLKLFFKINNEIQNIKEVNMKSGWKTSEFWLTASMSLINIVGALKGVIPADTAATALVVLNGIYNVMRALVKNPEITTLVNK